jgi:hypothetical protein
VASFRLYAHRYLEELVHDFRPGDDPHANKLSSELTNHFHTMRALKPYSLPSCIL